MHLSPPMAKAAVRSKAVVLLLTFCLLLLPFVDNAIEGVNDENDQLSRQNSLFSVSLWFIIHHKPLSLVNQY